MTSQPETPNPLRAMRQAKALSLDQLAYQADVTRQLIVRAEQAVYANPPPRLLNFLLNISDPASTSLNPRAVGFFVEDEVSVYHAYHKFQTQQRRKHYGLLVPSFNFSNVPSGIHPFVDWRVRSGIKARIGPAKFFCVHPALLHKYEVQTHLVNSTPGDLYNALIEAGYSSELLGQLEDAYYTYKQQTRKIIRTESSGRKV